MRYTLLLAFCLLAGKAIGSFAFHYPSDTSKVKRNYVPIIFYLPETGIGLGATVINTIQKNQATRPTQYLLSAVYTFKNQILLYAPFEIYGENNKNRFKGELGYYIFFYNYHGLGRSSRIEDLENYDVSFPRFDFNYARLIKDNL